MRNAFPTRRKMVQLGVGVAAWMSAAGVDLSAEPRRRIRSAQLGEGICYKNSAGGTWIAAWADDDNLYVSSDDTNGFNNACASNLAVNRIAGAMPPDIHGTTINPMKEFGKAGETRKEDGACWKACGITCVDGVLYLTVSRHLAAGDNAEPDLTNGGRSTFFPVQETWDASIMKSGDHGSTWSQMPKLGQPMFPGRSFSTPVFVDYGKDGADRPYEADKYTYAVSNDGAWNNGNWMTLGRVRRERIARLDPRDWEFVHGYDDNKAPIWMPGHERALYVFRAPDRTGMTGIHFLAPLGLYILPQWHYPRLDLKDPRRRWGVTRWEFYHAPAPWGPWTLFFRQEFEPEAWYNPSIASKFTSEDGRLLWIFTAGNNSIKEDYKLWMFPMTLDVVT
jgi:hypothetical protein